MKKIDTLNRVFESQQYIFDNRIQLTKHHFSELKSKLPRGIYWLQPCQRGKILWNWTLLQSYLLVGGDCPSHRSLVEEYISTLHPAA